MFGQAKMSRLHAQNKAEPGETLCSYPHVARTTGLGYLTTAHDKCRKLALGRRVIGSYRELSGVQGRDGIDQQFAAVVYGVGITGFELGE